MPTAVVVLLLVLASPGWATYLPLMSTFVRAFSVSSLCCSSFCIQQKACLTLD